MAVALRPSTALVVPAWINSIPEFADRAGGLCSTNLPSDNSTWGPSGFITLEGEAGGRTDIYLPVKRPVVQLDFWAVKPGTSKPPWWTATALLEAVIAACYDEARMRRLLTLTAGGVSYGTARVFEFYPLGKVRKITDDPNQYAHLQHDFQVHWAGM